MEYSDWGMVCGLWSMVMVMDVALFGVMVSVALWEI